MTTTRSSARKEEEEENYSEMEYSKSEVFDSDDDPTYDVVDDLHKTESKLAKLSIKRKPSSRDHGDSEVDDAEVSDMEEVSMPVLDKKDIKNLEQVQKLIDDGKVEELKVEQCKVYLRKHGLRLTGKKDVLIQRIKEHLEVLNGGAEKKYPPSSFVLNCKGDACMGDVVKFEQTVYEGYNVASRSACGPPCGTRIVAGRIVKESYGAAKQQHTFTVEVLWSKGQKPLPPLHPLLIKGRNLYKSNTMRQRWKDEGERHRVLTEKHKRGSLARSNRDGRIQEKEAKKITKGNRALPKEYQSSHQQKNITHESKQVARQQQTNQETNPQFCVQNKENFNFSLLRFQPNPPHHMSNIPTYNAQSSNPSHIVHPTFQFSKPAGSSFGSRPGYLENSFNGIAMASDRFQQTQQDPRYSRYSERRESSFPTSYLPECKYTAPTYAKGNVSYRPISDERYHPRPSSTRQKLCEYFPQGRCRYGNQCKFLHELDRKYC